jgi:hypothetical protein
VPPTNILRQAGPAAVPGEHVRAVHLARHLYSPRRPPPADSELVDTAAACTATQCPSVGGTNNAYPWCCPKPAGQQPCLVLGMGKAMQDAACSAESGAGFWLSECTRRTELHTARSGPYSRSPSVAAGQSNMRA